jgi:hypothetical protein
VATGTGGACAIGEDRGELKERERERWEEEDKVRHRGPTCKKLRSNMPIYLPKNSIIVAQIMLLVVFVADGATFVHDETTLVQRLRSIETTTHSRPATKESRLYRRWRRPNFVA